MRIYSIIIKIIIDLIKVPTGKKTHAIIYLRSYSYQLDIEAQQVINFMINLWFTLDKDSNVGRVPDLRRGQN